ncbi:MAG: hypothetical protein ACOYL6_00915 [Bacteriovoracaceae bacterium]
MEDASFKSPNLKFKSTAIPEVESIYRLTKMTKKSCDESAKVLGLFWGLYTQNDQQKIESHLLSCTFCQAEHAALRAREEQLKKTIPHHVLPAEAFQALTEELFEVTKNTYRPKVGALLNASFENEMSLKVYWTQNWQKTALGLAGIGLLTLIFLIPWI